MIYFLKTKQVIELHDKLIQSFGGSFGLRDLGLLESAIEMPKQGFGDSYFHEFPFDMAAAYLFHISKNHAFVDGNKRTAFFSTEVFLEMNGFLITADEKILEEFVVDSAIGKLSKDEISKFLEKNSKKI